MTDTTERAPSVRLDDRHTWTVYTDGTVHVAHADRVHRLTMPRDLAERVVAGNVYGARMLRVHWTAPHPTLTVNAGPPLSITLVTELVGWYASLLHRQAYRAG